VSSEQEVAFASERGAPPAHASGGKLTVLRREEGDMSQFQHAQSAARGPTETFRWTWAAMIVMGAMAIGGTSGCGRYGWMGAAAQEPFRRCICSHPACNSRQNMLAEEYAALAPSQRAGWLEQHGCGPDGFPLPPPRAVATVPSSAPPPGSDPEPQIVTSGRYAQIQAQARAEAEARRRERMRPRFEREVDEFTGDSRVVFRAGVPLAVDDALARWRCSRSCRGTTAGS
jgi:hypothetical protein